MTPLRCGPAQWRALRKPSAQSHKGDNGRLLILAGSGRYHGSLLLAVRAAARFCDLVYAHSTAENAPRVRRIKSITPGLIYIDARALPRAIAAADAFCVGPGWADDAANRRTLERVLKTGKPAVLDAGALAMLAGARGGRLRALLHAGVVLTPHRGEFERMAGVPATAGSVGALARRLGCVVLCKGPLDLIASPQEFGTNATHHVGMTKGGTGDVLAGLCAALLADHNAPFRAACAAAYLNGRAGERLARRMGSHYSAEDLAGELAFAAAAVERAGGLRRPKNSL